MSKVKDGNYIVIQAFMVKDLKLKGNELLIYAAIYGFSQTENQAFTGSLQYLADWTNSTKQGVIKNLKSLVAKGYITKDEQFINGVKFCEYRTTEFNGVLNKVEHPIKQSLTGGSKQSLTPPIKQSLPNNKDNENIVIDIIDNKTNKIDHAQLEKEFNTLWEAYPRKQGKANAFKAYEKARNKGVEFQIVLDGIYSYLTYIRVNKVEDKYIKQGSTWFNQQCWNDDYSIKRELTTADVADAMDFSAFREG